jgi:hypothetical protein
MFVKKQTKRKKFCFLEIFLNNFTRAFFFVKKAHMKKYNFSQKQRNCSKKVQQKTKNKKFFSKKIYGS